MQKQREALQLFRKGENVFLTGPGGTGKTTLIRRMFEDAQKRKMNVQVTALTGCAAILLKCRARTIHSFAGIGLGNGTIEEIISRVKANPNRVKNWKAVQILIVDEVSMMSRKLLQILDQVAKAIRKNDKIFGGIQIVFSGDFYQIRPVGRMEDPESIQFCFESPLWKELFQPNQHILLTTIFRQKDPVYTKILDQIRNGCLDEEGEEILKQLLNKPLEDGLIRPIQLLPTRRQVDWVNKKSIEKLDASTEVIFQMTTSPVSDIVRQREIDFLKKNLLCEESLCLRKGAQVMCIMNQTIENVFICNGSQGYVKDFSEEGYPIIHFYNGLETEILPHEWKSEVFSDVSVIQLPLILAWAVTIHKAQGATLETAEIDVGESIFECGQMYVALSRLKGLEGLTLKSFDKKSIKVDPKVKAFYSEILKKKY